VYGLVAGIVKLDDLGLYLTKEPGQGIKQRTGRAILWMAPWLMKSLSVLGTAAMFMVGGGILTHGIPGVTALVQGLVGGSGVAMGFLLPTLIDAVIGVVAGAVILVGVTLVQKMMAKGKSKALNQ
jgi:predicted DNA repair protein MutK